MASVLRSQQTKEMQVALPRVYVYVVAALEVISVIILAVLCSNLFIFYLEQIGEDNTLSQITATNNVPQRPTTDTSYPYLRSVDPFFDRSFDVTEESASQLPESTLDLKIYGIRATGNGDGTVILKSQGSKQRLSLVGDEIADNTVLTAIYAGRIEISRNGRLETIYLDSERTKSLSVNVSDVSRSQTSLNADFFETELIINFIKALELKPYRQDRRISGFVIGDDAKKSLAASAGLEIGDIIQSVNGNRLHSWERVLEIPDGVTGTIDIQLERRGELLNLALTPSSLGQ